MRKKIKNKVFLPPIPSTLKLIYLREVLKDEKKKLYDNG